LERVGGVEPHSAQLGRLASHLELTRNILLYCSYRKNPTVSKILNNYVL